VSSRPVDLSTRVGALLLPNPVMTASGTAGLGAELAAYFDLAALGAHVVKSLAAYPWPGNGPPRVAGRPGYMLNSVGLAGPGIAAWLDEELPALERCGARVVASVWGRSVDDYARAGELLSGAPACVVAVEVNVSCPNVEERHALFGASPGATARAVEAVAACGRPVWAKLSPNVADLVAVAEAAAQAGAQAVTLVNTAFGMAIDPQTRRFALGAGGGGVSGRALHPIAVRAVHDVHGALPELAIVGVGGVFTAEDAVELLLAGASAVQVGTATFVDPRAAFRLVGELERWCAARAVRRVAELVGAGGG